LRYVVCKSCHDTSRGEASDGKQKEWKTTEALAQAIDEELRDGSRDEIASA